MNADLELAIEKLNRLFNDRDSAEWWSQNIIDASQHLKQQEDWTKFYAYMANPTTFDASSNLPTLDTCMEEVDLSYDNGMEEVRYQNGPDTIIHVRRKPKIEDEKIDLDEKEDV